MDIRSQPLPENICIFFRQYFCCRRKRRWNPINQRKPNVRREKSRVTFAAKVNKVEPLRYHSTIEETFSEDDSIHRYPYEDRLSAADKKSPDENASTTALLDERLSESGESSDVDSECKADFVEQYVKDTIAAALTQWKKDYEKNRQTLELQDIDTDDDDDDDDDVSD